MSGFLWLFGSVALVCIFCDIFSAENRMQADVWNKLMDEIDEKCKVSKEEEMRMDGLWGNRIVFADEDKTTIYSIEMQRVMSAIAFFMSNDPEKWLKGAWVSDMSSMRDFGLEDEEIVMIGETLGVPVGDNDVLWEIAKAIHEKEKQ